MALISLNKRPQSLKCFQRKRIHGQVIRLTCGESEKQKVRIESTRNEAEGQEYFKTPHSISSPTFRSTPHSLTPTIKHTPIISAPWRKIRNAAAYFSTSQLATRRRAASPSSCTTMSCLRQQKTSVPSVPVRRAKARRGMNSPTRAQASTVSSSNS